jgi:hypothetical protein
MIAAINASSKRTLCRFLIPSTTETTAESFGACLKSGSGAILAEALLTRLWAFCLRNIAALKESLRHIAVFSPVAAGLPSLPVGQGDVGPEPRHQAVAAIASGSVATLAFDADDVQGKLAE